MLSTENVRDFISKSLDLEIDSIVEINEIRGRSGREVIDCLYQVDGNIERHILKVYHKGFDDDSELGAQVIKRLRNDTLLGIARGNEVYTSSIKGLLRGAKLKWIMDRVNEELSVRGL